jgi:hypothetical protein
MRQRDEAMLRRSQLADRQIDGVQASVEFATDRG